MSILENAAKKMLRKWLRKKTIRLKGASNEALEECFHWVYDAPLKEWRDRLWCLWYGNNSKEMDEILLLLNK